MITEVMLHIGMEQDITCYRLMETYDSRG